MPRWRRARCGTAFRVLTCAAAVAATVACAARARRPETDAALGRAAGDVERGCYLCLRDGFEAYRRLLATYPSSVTARQGAFGAALLLAVRERQLGLADHGYLAVARDVAKGLGPDTPALIEMAASVPPGRTRTVPDDWADRVRLVRERLPEWRRVAAAAGSVGTALVDAVVCAYPHVAGLTERPPYGPDDTPLVTYGRAVCLGDDADTLARLVGSEPRFAEATYALGVVALGQGRVRDAEAQVAAARSALPGWPAASLTLGSIRLALERFEDAARDFNEVLAARPDDPDALLGGVQALSYMNQHDAAIAMADRLLGRGMWHQGDAHYWRAWNLTHLGRLDEAVSDVEAARRLMATGALFKLGGIIAFRQGRLDDARADLLRARQIAPADCEAAFYLGGVDRAREGAAGGADAFAEAATCYEDDERRQRDVIRAGEREGQDPRVLARRAEGADLSHRQQGASHGAAAVALVARGDRDAARRHATRALDYPEWAERGRAVLDQLGSPGDAK